MKNGDAHKVSADDDVRSCTLSLRDVNLSVRVQRGSWWNCGCVRRETKHVLSDVNLTMASGQIVAVIGSSGSGKTSLLDAIAHRHSGDVKGDIRLNGRPITADVFSKRGSYVIQHDRLLPGLTVRETLMYTGRIVFAGQCSWEEVSKKVDKCLLQVGLKHIASSRVGGVLKRGISGGEKRRLSVAIQLISEPDLLLLDEPTTGLDSFTAHYLLDTLAAIAHLENKLVILTIHQPRSDIFHLLDTVAILSKGEVVYFGPIRNLVPYFTKLGHPCPKYANPLDFYIDLVSMDYRSDAAEETTKERLASLVRAYSTSDISADVYMYINQLEGKQQHLSEPNNPENDDIGVETQAPRRRSCAFHCSRFFILCAAHMRRMYVHIFRDRKLVTSRVNNMVLFALFLWLFCWRLGTNWKSIQDRVGLLYQVAAVSCAVGCMTAFTNFPLLRDLYYRESQDGMYSCVHFLSAYYIHIIPFQLVAAVAFAAWAYWALGMYPDVGRYFIFSAVVFIQQHLGELQTIACMAVIYNANTARAAANMIITLSMQYASGLIKSADDLIPPLKQLTYINHYRYASQILLANELTGLQFDCRIPASNCSLAGSDVLFDMYPEAVGSTAKNFGILAAMTVAYWIIVVLLFLAKGRKILH